MEPYEISDDEDENLFLDDPDSPLRLSPRVNVSPPPSRPMKPLPSRIRHSEKGKVKENAIQIPSHSPTPEVAPSIDAVTSSVLEIIPDVDVEYLQTTVINLQEERGGINPWVERVLHAILEIPAYPRADRALKRKRSA